MRTSTGPLIVTEEKVEESMSDRSDKSSEMSHLDQLDELGLDKNYLVKELGCDSKKVLMDEDLLD